MIRRITAFLLALSLSSHAFGVFHAVVSYRSTTAPDQKLHAVSEFHYGYLGSLDQLHRLIDWCKNEKEISGESPLVIAEDHWARECNNNPLFVQSKKEYQERIAVEKESAFRLGEYAESLKKDDYVPGISMLPGLVDYCHAEVIDCITADFRKIVHIPSYLSITKELIYAEITHQIALLRNYTDPKIVKICESFIEKFLKKNAIILAALTNPAISLATAIRMIPDDGTFATELVDAEILQHIDINKDRKAIVLCFGGRHLENIHTTILSLGYEVESFIGQGIEYMFNKSDKIYREHLGLRPDAPVPFKDTCYDIVFNCAVKSDAFFYKSSLGLPVLTGGIACPAESLSSLMCSAPKPEQPSLAHLAGHLLATMPAHAKSMIHAAPKCASSSAPVPCADDHVLAAAYAKSIASVTSSGSLPTASSCMDPKNPLLARAFDDIDYYLPPLAYYSTSTAVPAVPVAVSATAST